MDEKRYEAARERVKEIKGFYTHLLVFVAVMMMLFVIDVLDGSGGVDWVYFPLAGWGAGLLIHGFNVFVIEGFFGKEWEERKIRELLGEKPKRRADFSAPDGELGWDDAGNDEARPLADLVAEANESQRSDAARS